MPGVVGLAIAERLSRDTENVILIEKNKRFGEETSSRNSEVIHAGIYYPKGSLKAVLCVKGRKMLYDFCKSHDIPHNKCGKVIVATNEEEVGILEGIRQKALANGVEEIRFIDQEELRQLEPNVAALAALYSPSTGIIDSHSFMKQLETLSSNHGVQFAYGATVSAIRKIDAGYEITIQEVDGSSYTYTSRIVVNSAGLQSDKIAAMLGIDDENLRIRFCKGEYFRVNPPKNRLLSRLVYPVPNPNMEGIGIHVTVDMGGGVKLGPDVTWLDSNDYDYRLTASKQEAFFKSAKRFLPFLTYDDIAPEMAGLRPKIQKKGGPEADFYICEESLRGLPGFVNLIGIESPGLTASLAIADHVAGLLNHSTGLEQVL